MSTRDDPAMAAKSVFACDAFACHAGLDAAAMQMPSAYNLAYSYLLTPRIGARAFLAQKEAEFELLRASITELRNGVQRQPPASAEERTS